MKDQGRKVITVVLTGLLAAGLVACGKNKAKEGDKVKVHYTLKLKDGKVFDSSVDREPLQLTLGENLFIPAFEQAIIGMKPGESKTIKIPAAEAYGLPSKDRIKAYPRKDFSSQENPQVGQYLTGRLANGKFIRTKVVEVTETTITLDSNHPLAGQDLTFEIQFLELEKE